MGSDEIGAVLDRFFAAIEAGDLATVAELLADEVGVWHSVTGDTADKATTLAILRWLTRPGVTVRYEPQEQLVAGTRVARRHLLHVGVDGHEPLTLPVSMYLTVEGGRITGVDEYTDRRDTDELIAVVRRGQAGSGPGGVVSGK
jgi:ketosteroid isomerase-like protein